MHDAGRAGPGRAHVGGRGEIGLGGPAGLDFPEHPDQAEHDGYRIAGQKDHGPGGGRIEEAGLRPRRAPPGSSCGPRGRHHVQVDGRESLGRGGGGWHDAVRQRGGLGRGLLEGFQGVERLRGGADPGELVEALRHREGRGPSGRRRLSSVRVPEGFVLCGRSRTRLGAPPAACSAGSVEVSAYREWGRPRNPI